jgi:hypothetical protein
MKESQKRIAAANSRAAAGRSRGESTIKAKSREADRYEADANAAGKDAATWQSKVSQYIKEEARLSKQLSDAELSEKKTADRKQRDADKRRDDIAASAARENIRLQQELAAQLTRHESELALLRQPRQETLRLLVLTASGEGDLRVGRELKRIQDAVRFSSGRDLVALDTRPAATSKDLLEGLTRTRPHVVHFSGHANDSVVLFEEDVDESNVGVVVSGQVLASALQAVDDPPLLVVLNACSSAPQAERIVEGAASFAVGHSDSILDGDAIAFSAQFYAALADGQSIQAAFDLSKVALQLSGTPDYDLPALYSAAGADPREAVLVLPPN